jgi:23S rRNA (cytidine1920-2'-O)/16S rRNA (cytidine1409-2'-O)-methyltransferase
MFVSRAGSKLEYALNEFHIDVSGKICADLGCSTGGFTDCLLQKGAAKIYAVDTGYGVLAWKLRTDPRVVVMERTNALFLGLPEQVDFVSVDVSWTPQRLIIPRAVLMLKPGGVIVSLVKPHYEAHKAHLTPEESEIIAQKTKKDLVDTGFILGNFITSPLLGEKGGNTEYLIQIRAS